MRVSVKWAVALLVLCSPLGAQFDEMSSEFMPPCNDGDPWIITVLDATDEEDCDDTPSGSAEAVCICLDGTIAPLGAGGGGTSNSFETINTPAGTDPVADSATDTLNLVCGSPLQCPGTALSDTITLSVANQSANLVLAGPESGSATVPSFRALVTADLPAPFQEYDPKRPPSSCAVCDEFSNGCTLTRSTGNADSSSISCVRDGLLVAGDGGRDEITVEWFDPPSSGNVDFTVAALIHMSNVQQTSGPSCGIAILHGGTVATPSAILVFYESTNNGSGTDFRLAYQNFSGYTMAGVTNIWNIFPATGRGYGLQAYYQLRYVDSTRVVTAAHSESGYVFGYPDTETKTLSADPIKVGIVARMGAECFVEFIRMRTDADRLNVGE